jgi:hypothetical protein
LLLTLSRPLLRLLLLILRSRAALLRLGRGRPLNVFGSPLALGSPLLWLLPLILDSRTSLLRRGLHWGWLRHVYTSPLRRL